MADSNSHFSIFGLRFITFWGISFRDNIRHGGIKLWPLLVFHWLLTLFWRSCSHRLRYRASQWLSLIHGGISILNIKAISIFITLIRDVINPSNDLSFGSKIAELPLCEYLLIFTHNKALLVVVQLSCHMHTVVSPDVTASLGAWHRVLAVWLVKDRPFCF